MKIITRKSSNLSLYSIADDVEVTLESSRIVVGNPVKFTVSDCNSGNVNLYENVTDTPEDWVGHKYLYNGSWSANPDWVEPVALELDENGQPIVPEPEP